MSNINLISKSSGRYLPNNLEKIKTDARERRRNILHLILRFLKDSMLEQTAESLVKEALLDLTYQACENIDLDIILQEYQSYYYTKFQKYPKIVRKLDEGEIKLSGRGSRRGKSAKRTAVTPVPAKEKTESPSDSEDFQFEIISLNSVNQQQANNQKSDKTSTKLVELEQCITENTNVINQILIQNVGVNWGDCLGLENVIETIKESTIYPLQYPDIFKGMVPWRGVLLHGPPGTGKTLLAKALASEGCTTFFNVTSSTIISKWRGESEKLIKQLFDVAKLNAPSTIFFDEIESLVAGAQDVQHEASRRFRSELLIQLDGISSTDSQVFILASTNSPWDLDGALLRRFDKRILVDMPSKEARMQILKHHLKKLNVNMSLKDYEEFTNLTEYYSGSDIKNLTKEVKMRIIRDQIKYIEKSNKDVAKKCITFDDIKIALQKIRSSVTNSTCKKYYQWQNEHGAV